MGKKDYREWVKAGDLVKTEIAYKDTDLCIMGKRKLKAEAMAAARKYRGVIEDYIKTVPEFKDSLKPIEAKGSPPDIIKRMIGAGKAARVGPMAAVAGAIAEFVGIDLLKSSEEIIVENGGDIFIKSSAKRRFGIFAGSSILTGRLTFEIMPDETPLGICTSSGTVGHSLSFGKADAVCIISKDTALADATATAAGNMLKAPGDIEKTIDFARSIPGVIGVIAIAGDKFGSWGRISFKER